MAPTKKSASVRPKTRTSRASSTKSGQSKSAKKSSAQPKKVYDRVVKPKKKGTIVDSFKKQERKPFSFPTKISLSIIPAVNQLPINPDLLAIGLARYGGFAVVSAGAIFAVYFVHALGLFTPGLHFMASVADSLLLLDPQTIIQTVPDDSFNSNSSAVSESAYGSHMTYSFMLLTASLFVMSIGMTLLILAEYLEHVRTPKSATPASV